jgi:rhodanese-related sulfurtransferase
VLAALGYTNVREYVEGKKDWRAAGLPLERSVKEPAPST